MDSNMSNQNVERIEQAWTEAKQYTRPVVCLKRVGENLFSLSLGSCVEIQADDNHRIAVTCRHVVANADFVSCQVPPVDLNGRLLQAPEVSASKILAMTVEPDLAALAVDDKGASGTSCYRLAHSAKLTADLLTRFVGVTAIIWGMFGGKTIVEEHKIATLLSMPPYAAKGIIRTVRPDVIVATFEEHIEVVRNIRDFPQLADINIDKGQSRHLGGMSGSGLWVVTADGIMLAGILRRPEDEIDANPHIEFIPVWVVRDWRKAQLERTHLIHLA